MRILFILLTFGLVFQASAQSISGQLAEDPEGAPLGYGIVALYKATDSTLVAGTISDSTGIFFT